MLLILTLALVWMLAPVPGSAQAPAPAQEVVQTESAAEPGELLDADELADLAAMDEEPGPEVVGGALNNQELTYIVIALAAAVLVLVLS